MMANTPSPIASTPTRRALVPKPPMVMASSQGIANTKSQSEANASFARGETFSCATGFQQLAFCPGTETTLGQCKATGTYFPNDFSVRTIECWRPLARNGSLRAGAFYPGD